MQNIGKNDTGYQSVLGLMQLVYNIISPSNKRLNWFNIHQKKNIYRQRLLSIKGLSEKFWVYHYRCDHTIKKIFDSIICTLNRVINDNRNKPEQIATSKGALLQLENWDFIFWLIVLMETLVSINHLNTLLQLK